MNGEELSRETTAEDFQKLGRNENAEAAEKSFMNISVLFPQEF